jgi:hypothetical protein
MMKSSARWELCKELAAPLTVAVVIVVGLGWLTVENLNGSVASRQSIHDRAVAIRNLLFRD